MPLSILLQEVFEVITRRGPDHGRPVAISGGYLTQLVPFGRLAELEETIIDRARSAFLVHWFGRSLPTFRSSLRSYIVNIDHLRRRYQAVKAAAETPEVRGVNLTEPLAGLAGSIVGIALSPGGMLAILVAKTRQLPVWARILVGVVWGPAMVGLAFEVAALVGAAGGLALPLGLAGGILAGALNEPISRGAWELFGALARALTAARGFLETLLGPREDVRNPILRQVLEVLDRFAALFAFAIALVAILVTRVGPLLVPLAAQVGPLQRLALAVIDAVTFILTDIGAVVRASFSGRGSPLMLLRGTLFGGIPRMARRFLGVLRGFATDAREILVQFARQADERIRRWLGRTLVAVFRLVASNPAFRTIFAAIEAMDVLRGLRWSAPTPPRPPGSPPAAPSAPSRPSFLGRVARGALAALGAPPPPVVPALPSRASVEAAIGPPPSLPLSMSSIDAVHALVPASGFGMPYRPTPDALAAVARAGRTPGVFAAERRALEHELGGTQAQALRAIRDQEVPLRAQLLLIVGRVSPPEIRARMPELLGVFQALDERLYRLSPAEAAAARPPAFPVQDLSDSGRLRPVVARLTFRVAGGYEPEVRTFRDQLTQVLRRQEYQAPAAP